MSCPPRLTARSCRSPLIKRLLATVARGFRLLAAAAVFVGAACAPPEEGAHEADVEEDRVVGPGVAEVLCPEGPTEADTLFPWGELNSDYDRNRASTAWRPCQSRIAADLDLHLTVDDLLVGEPRDSAFRFDGKACLGPDSVAIFYCFARIEGGAWRVGEYRIDYPVEYAHRSASCGQ